MEEEGCSRCIYNFSNISGFKFEPTEKQICEYYLPILINNQKLACNHVIAKQKMYEDYSTPWQIFKDDDPHWLLTTSQTSKNKDEDSNKKKSVMYAFTNLKKNGKKNFFRKSGCGTWNQQNSEYVLNEDKQVIGSNKGFRFVVSEEEREKIGDNNYGSWTMHEYSLNATARNPRLSGYAICKIRKEVEVEDDKEIYGPVDNNIPDYTQLPVVQVENHQLLNGDYNHLPIVQVEDHQLLNGNMFASQVAMASVPYQNYGSAYSDMLLQAAEGGGTDNMNPEPSLVFDVNCSQDYNQFGNENIFFSPPVDIVSHHEDYGEWNDYAHMLSQPAEGGTSSNGVCDQPQPDNMQGSMNLMSTVNRLLNKNQNQQESDGLLLPDTSTDLVNVAAATSNQLQQGNDDLPKCQSLRKRKNFEDSTVTKKRKKVVYLTFN